MMIPASIVASIETELSRLEQEEQITILWACESGSRAWGFESIDSDYDVRFIYVRQTAAYLRASPLRDVIERPISEVLDISGWDLPKALGLFRKSNPPLLEWLQSPIIYRRNEAFHRAMTELMPAYHSPIGAMYHYLSMAERNMRNYLNEETIRLKRYFYILRPVLACMWIDRGLGIPPIEFQKMLDALLPDGELRNAIDVLKERKKAGEELNEEPPLSIISEFIIEQVAQLTEATKETQFTNAWEPLDALLVKFIIECNGDKIVTGCAPGLLSERRSSAG